MSDASNGSAAGTGNPSWMVTPKGPADQLWNLHGEEFRTLRTKAVKALDLGKHKLIMVTSSLPREGKTTVSVNMARSLAQASWRTLLIDGDMRAPDVHYIFDLDRSPGFSDLLQRHRFTTEAVRDVGFCGLEVMPAGSPTETPAELINSSFTPMLLREMAQRYDYVVLDAPPLLSITDTLLLGRFVDGVIMVVQSGTTPREVARGALEQAEGLPILGMVVNGVPPGDGYYSYYKNYYGS